MFQEPSNVHAPLTLGLLLGIYQKETIITEFFLSRENENIFLNIQQQGNLKNQIRYQNVNFGKLWVRYRITIPHLKLLGSDGITDRMFVSPRSLYVKAGMVFGAGVFRGN